MPQYWIQTPVENAKEVVQRWIDANSGTLTDYAGATVSYDEQCEVVFYNTDLTSWQVDYNYIYFGNFYIPIVNSGGACGVYDTNGNIITFDLGDSASPPEPGVYKGVIWNHNNSSFSASQGIYFVGYKFNITTP